MDIKEFFSSTLVNSILTTIGIIVAVIGFLIVVLKKFRKWFYDEVISRFLRVSLHSPNYYNDAFLIKNINKSRFLVRIVSVRNQRVNQADIIEAYKRFLDRNPEGKVEIFRLDENSPDCIIKEIMSTLPNPPKNVETFRKQVVSQDGYYKSLIDESADYHERIIYYKYNCLPVIHMCQFDCNIFVGFQMFDKPYHKVHSLLDYAIKYSTKNKIGKAIEHQFEILKKKSVVI